MIFDAYDQKLWSKGKIIFIVFVIFLSGCDFITYDEICYQTKDMYKIAVNGEIYELQPIKNQNLKFINQTQNFN